MEDEIAITYAKPDPPKQKIEGSTNPPPILDSRIVETKLNPIIEPKLVLPEIDVTFKVDLPNVPPAVTEKEVDDDPWVRVEEMAKFPGGTLGLLEYVMAEVKYPAIARENGITGIVYVYYVVNEKGNVIDVSLRRGVNPFLDREALRAVKTTTGYTPGKQRGKLVKVEFTLPIRFELN